MNDNARLDWLEQEQNGLALIHDDNSHWAVAYEGLQNVIKGDEPADLATTYHVPKSAFRRTIREAIDAAMLEAGACLPEPGLQNPPDPV